MAGNLFSGVGNLFSGVFNATNIGQYLQEQKAAQAQQQFRQAMAAQIMAAQGQSGAQAPPSNPTATDFWPTPDQPAQPGAIPGAPNAPPPNQPFSGAPQPDLMRSLAAASALQGKYGDSASILKPPDPLIQYDTGGNPYNAHDAATMNTGRAANRSNVNGTIVDLNDPSNTNRTVPQLDKGQEFLYDSNHRPVAVRNIPGYAGAIGETTSAQANATAGANAAVDMVAVPQPDGTTQMMTRRDAAALLGGRTPPPGGAGPPRPGTGAGRSQSPANAAYQGKQAEGAAAHFDEIQKGGEAANGQIATLQTINGLLGNFEGGKFAPTGIDIASAANSLGFRMDPKTSNAQAAQAIGNQMALQLRSPAGGAGMPGSMSNQDRNFLASMVPGLLQSAQGRQQLTSYFSTIATRAQQRAELARKWQDATGRLDAPDAKGRHFDDYWTSYINSHPLFKP